MKSRKPTISERVKGSWQFFFDGVISLLTFKLGRAKFDFYMILPTVKGKFEVAEKGDGD